MARQSVLIFSSRKTNSLMEGGWIWTQGAAAQHANPRASEWGRTDGRFGSNRERQSNSYSNGENPSEESSEDALITHRRQRGEPAEARTGRSPSALRPTRPREERPRRRAEDPAAEGRMERGASLPAALALGSLPHPVRSAGRYVRRGAGQRSAMAGGRSGWCGERRETTIGQ